MLKHSAASSLALAGFFVLPGMAVQQDGSQGLLAQLDATVASIDYLGELVKRLEAGDRSALPLLLGATEPALLNELQSEAKLVTLRGDVSRLRLALDRLLEKLGVDPYIPGVPGPTAPRSSLEERVPRTPDRWSDGGLAPTTGLRPGQVDNLKSVIPPLEQIDPESRRTGTERVDLEDADFTADAVRQGKLLFRAKRFAESIQLLRPLKDDFEARYWLAQSYRAMERIQEAQDILRLLAENEAAGAFKRYAQSDLEFIEFERQLALRRAAAKGTSR